jgi:hypothetical protein
MSLLTDPPGVQCAVMVRFLVQVVVSYLPRPWRRGPFRIADEELRAATIVSAALQALVFLVILVFGYFRFMHSVMAAEGMEQASLGAMEKGGEAAMSGLGVLFTISFLLTPLALLCEYFIIEGFVRGIAAVATGEAPATLPLQLACWAAQRLQAHRAERAMGERVVDLVQPGPNSGLIIHSCRTKDWTPLNTIRYQDVDYELASAEEGSLPRRFIYHLRMAPSWKVLRGFRQYDPNEPLLEQTKQE